jgi:hypothetical protein
LSNPLATFSLPIPKDPLIAQALALLCSPPGEGGASKWVFEYTS